MKISKNRVNGFILKSIFISLLFIISYLAFSRCEVSIVKHLWDKFNHFIAFFTLFILFAFSFANLTTIKRFALLLLYAVFIEFVQYFLPYRECSFLDIIADFIGMVGGYVVLKYVLILDFIKIKKVFI